MDIQVFISTINKKVEEIAPDTLSYEKLIVINQKPKLLDDSYKVTYKDKTQWIDIDQKGLSKSRNYAMNMANAEAIYLTDDDIVLKNNFKEIITRSFQDNPRYDILAFNVKGIEEKFKEMVTYEKELNLVTSMKLSSVQIVFRLEFLRNNNIQFDERFGAGATYSMGEENILLFDAIKKGAKIKFIPETIADLHMGDSTWFQGFNEKYLFDKGATFWRMFGLLAPLYSLTYCLRKRKLYQENMGIIKAYVSTLKGMKSFLSK